MVKISTKENNYFKYAWIGMCVLMLAFGIAQSDKNKEEANQTVQTILFSN